MAVVLLYGRPAQNERKDHMKRLLFYITIGLLGAGTPLLGQHETGCNSEFTGHDRAEAKNRPPSAGAGYDVKGAPTPLTLDELFGLTCQLNNQLDDVVSRTADTVPGVETVKVTVRAYLLAVRWEADNDLHVQIGPKPKWTRGQLVVEIPAGQDFCGPRTTVFDAVTGDVENHGGNTIHKGHIMRDKIPVDVTGFLFFDASHGNTTDGCDKNGGRGIKGTFKDSPVRGLWEIHPVIDVKLVE
jgi:hypothetical protein